MIDSKIVEIVKKLNSKNVSSNTEKTRQRLEAIWKSAINQQKQKAVEFGRYTRTESFYRARRKGRISVRMVIALALAFNIDPFYINADTDVKSECSEEKILNFMRKYYFKHLVLEMIKNSDFFLFELLDSYARKERSYVANYFLSGKREGSLIISPCFLQRLEKALGQEGELTDNDNYYAALEYNFDWLWVSLNEYLEGKVFHPNDPQERTDEDFVKGENNKDIDLLLVMWNHKNSVYNFYLIEAKYNSTWGVSQICKKLKLLIKLLKMPLNNTIGKFHYIFYSNDKDDNNKILNEIKRSREGKKIITLEHFGGFFCMEVNKGYRYKETDSLLYRIQASCVRETSILANDAVFGGFINQTISDALRTDLMEFFRLQPDKGEFLVMIDCALTNLFETLDIPKLKGEDSIYRTDCDAFVICRQGDIYHLIFCEAKAYTDWKKNYGEKQLEDKIKILKDLAKKIDDKKFKLYWISYGRENPFYEKSKQELLNAGFAGCAEKKQTFETRYALRNSGKADGYRYFYKETCFV